MKYKMIATDMDGTLLNNRQEIPEANKEAVKQFLTLGMKVVIATGRMYPSVRRYLKELKLLGSDTYCLCGNGTELYDLADETMLWQMKLDGGTAAEIYKRTKNMNVEFVVFNNDKFYVESMTEMAQKEKYINDMELLLFDPKTAFDNDVSKVIAVKDNKTLRDIAAELSCWVSDKANMMFSSPVYLEFFNKDADKGRGLEKVAEMLGIESAEIIAAGDSHNDFNMIKYAGLGVAAANAVSELKAVADMVTNADNNTGVLLEIANIIRTDS